MAMQRTSIRNILHAARTRSALSVMLRKVSRRFFDTQGRLGADENINWLNTNCADFETEAVRADPSLWTETGRFHDELSRSASEILAQIPHPIGGGGYYPMIYFLARILAPRTVVETGVAAGFSSAAILEAIRKNGVGHLWSSDFPYFRLPDPEQYIGIVVEDDLKVNWTLHTAGDEYNLPLIGEQTGEIDMFHYDSDKSYNGREWAMKLLQQRMTDATLVIMDDIQDNSFFHDLVATRDPRKWAVYSFEGKFIGVYREAGLPWRALAE